MGLPEHWKRHIEAWQASGLTQAAYCREHGLNANTFSARRHDWRRRASAARAGVVPVRVVEPAPPPGSAPAGALVLTHGAGRLELPATVSPGWVAELLRALA